MLPFFIANAGTWISLSFKTSPGTSLWYLPTALGIVMVYWWGPRALPGIYLNAVLCTPLWGLPWKWSLLYALPETLEVGLSWLFFVKIAKGKSWLPNLSSILHFLILGCLVPTFIASIYLVSQLFILGNIDQHAGWTTWQLMFTADLTTKLVFAVPLLTIFTKPMTDKGWTLIREHLPVVQFLPDDKKKLLDGILISGSFLTILVLILLSPIHELRVGHGLLLILISIRYGVNIAALGTSWFGSLAFLLPMILADRLGSFTADDINLLSTNLDILFLCGITLVTGRAISDLVTEIAERSLSEENLRSAETKYRTLAEKIPPIIYMARLNQHVGVTYISPQITSLGFTQEEWTADPELWLRQMHPDDQKRIVEEIEHVQKSGEPFKSEYRLITRSGEIRWFLDEAMDILDNNGRVIFRQGFMLDITARKLAEEALSAREQYLELLNDMTRTILLSKDLNSTLSELAGNMAKLTNADDCYITRWDEERLLTIPSTSTANLERPYSSNRSDPYLVTMTASVLQAERVLAADDVFNSPYVSVEIAKKYPARSVLGIPLIVRERKLGAAIVAYNSPHHFTSWEIERAEHAAKHIAVALWNAQKDLELTRRLQESDALAKISLALSEKQRVSYTNVLELIVNSAKELIPGAEQAVIHSLDEENNLLMPEAAVGFQNAWAGQAKLKLGEGIAGQAIISGETLNVTDVHTDKRFLNFGIPVQFRSLMVTPIISGEKTLGSISVQSKKPNAFAQNEANLLRTLGANAAIAIENARLLESTQKALRETNALYRISRGLLALNAEELLDDAVDLLEKNFGYHLVQVYLIEPKTGDFILKASSGETGQLLKEKNHSLKVGSGIIGHVAETRKPFFTNDVDQVIFHIKNPIRPEIKSEMAVPIKAGEQLLGILDIQQSEMKDFTPRDLQLVGVVADQLAASLQKADLYENLQKSLQQEKAIRNQLVQNERLAIMGRLLASVSHELNNPLQAIQNALFLLREEKGISPQGLNDLDIVLAESERMAGMIDRLRTTYRPTQTEDFRPTQVNRIIEELFALIATHLRKNEVVFEFNPDPELPIITALPDQIRQVALNLLMNAVEAMPNGGKLTVYTRYQYDTHEVLMTVSDTGSGIPSSLLPLIFDPFITNKQRGTGIGLTISHDIVMKHNGRIEADNNYNRGATFRVWLPVDQVVNK